MGKAKLSEDLIKKIRYLRERGYSLPEIAIEVKVGRATAFRYTQGVEILPEYRDEWTLKRGGSRKRMHVREQASLEDVKKILFDLSKKEKLIYLAALYWAEGSKSDLRLSNTDPALIKIFLNGLREIFNVTDDRIQVSLRLYEDLDVNKSKIFWSGVTGISPEEITSIDILKGKKIGKLEYGMCRVRVKKGISLILKKINAVNKIMGELFVPVA